jgi:hypothetical protein
MKKKRNLKNSHIILWNLIHVTRGTLADFVCQAIVIDVNTVIVLDLILMIKNLWKNLKDGYGYILKNKKEK